MVLPDWSIKFGPDNFDFRSIVLRWRVPADDKFFADAQRFLDEILSHFKAR